MLHNENVEQGTEDQGETTSELPVETPGQEARLAVQAEEVIAENKVAEGSLSEVSDAESAEIERLSSEIQLAMGNEDEGVELESELTEEEKGFNTSRADYEQSLSDASKRIDESKKNYPILTRERATPEELMIEDAEKENREKNIEIQNQEYRDNQQGSYERTATARNEKRSWAQKLFRRGKVTSEDVMMEDAQKDDKKFEQSKERYDASTKLFSGEMPIDSNMEMLKNIARETGPSEVMKIFETDMEKNTQPFSTKNAERLDQFRDAIGKGDYADGFYKQMLLRSLAKGWTDTMESVGGGLTGRFAEFNTDRDFVLQARKIMDKKK